MATNTVAVVDRDMDSAESLGAMLLYYGFEVVVLSGKEGLLTAEEIKRFISRHDVAIIIYDVPYPYQLFLGYLEEIRNGEVAAGRRFIITSTNQVFVKRHLDGNGDGVLAVVSKPYDVDWLIGVLRRAV